MKAVKIAFVVLCFAFAAGVQPAQAGIIEFLFPTLKKQEPDPAVTLVAPFADAPVPGSEAVKQGLPENAAPLNFPHRTTAQVSDWAVMAASEAMTFEADDYQTVIDKVSAHFSAEGKAEYLKFLQETQMTGVLDSRKVHIRSFVEEIPLLLNEGAIDGRYRWLYEVTMMISYMDRSMKGYKNAEPPVNQKLILTIQIGRTPSTEPGRDITVERWSGRIQNIAKN